MKFFARLRRNRVAEVLALAGQVEQPSRDLRAYSRRRITLATGCSCFMLRTGPHQWVKVPCDLHDPRLWEELERMVRS